MMPERVNRRKTIWVCPLLFVSPIIRIIRIRVLFVGSERAGKRAAAIQSLLATAKLNRLDPATWLRDTLAKLPTCLNSQIDSLLPFPAEALQQTASQA
jgi:hypothetical protein